jgi:hypothetical protein
MTMTGSSKTRRSGAAPQFWNPTGVQFLVEIDDDRLPTQAELNALFSRTPATAVAAAR